MKCSYCDQLALAKCSCSEPYMCEFHFGKHILSLGNHPFERAKVLENQKLSQIRKLAIKRINEIERAKSSIILATKTLIRTLETSLKVPIGRLDELGIVYHNFLRKVVFFETDNRMIEDLETMEISVQDVEIDDITKKIERLFLQDLLVLNERLEHNKIQFLNHHVGGFRCGAITRNGKILVTGCLDSTIRAWDLLENKQKFVLYGHNSRVYCLALTDDSQHIISGSLDASVRIWSFKQKKQVAVLKGHKGAIFAICYVEARSLIVSGDTKCELIVWDYASHAILKKIQLPQVSFSMIAMKNQFNIIAGLNPDIVRYELENTSLVTTLKGHSDTIWSLALTTDEQKLISGSNDQKIIIWNLITSNKTIEINAACEGINSIALSLNEEMIVSGSDDYSVRVWSMQTGEQIKKFEKNTSNVNCILRDNSNFISLSYDSAIGKLEMENGIFQLNWFLKPFEYDFVDFTGNSGLIGYGRKNEAAIWDLEVDKHVLAGHPGKVQFVEISKDGRLAIFGSSSLERNLIYWDLEKNIKICELRGHSNIVLCAAFSKDCMIAASGSGDKTVRIWNLNKRRQDSEFKGHTEAILSIKFIDNKNLVVSGGADKTVRIWNVIKKTQYAVLNGHSYPIYKIVVTEDGRHIVACDDFDGIQVLNVEKKRQELVFRFEEEAASWLKENRVSIESVKRFLKA